MSRTQINPALSSGLTTFASPTNILDNGGFEVWQRGTSFVNPANNSYTTDRWQWTYAGTAPVVTISQESSTVDTGNYSCKFVYTSVSGTSFTQFGQPIENYKAYAGQTVTLSMRVWSNIAGAVLEIASAAGNFAQSSAHPGDSAWHTLTVTYTVVANPSFLECWFNAPLAAGTHYIDSAILVLGSTAANFYPTNPQVDLARCQRYYEQGDSGYIFTGYFTNNPTTGIVQIPFKVTKRITPTMTNNFNSNSNISGSVTFGINQNGFGVNFQVASTVVYQIASNGVPWTASADI